MVMACRRRWWWRWWGGDVIKDILAPPVKLVSACWRGDDGGRGGARELSWLRWLLTINTRPAPFTHSASPAEEPKKKRSLFCLLPLSLSRLPCPASSDFATDGSQDLRCVSVRSHDALPSVRVSDWSVMCLIFCKLVSGEVCSWISITMVHFSH